MIENHVLMLNQFLVQNESFEKEIGRIGSLPFGVCSNTIVKIDKISCNMGSLHLSAKMN